jgi:hypothetical protein
MNKENQQSMSSMGSGDGQMNSNDKKSLDERRSTRTGAFSNASRVTGITDP